MPVSSVYQAQSGGLIGTFFASYTPAGGRAVDVQFRLLLSSDGRIQGVTVSRPARAAARSVELAAAH